LKCRKGKRREDRRENEREERGERRGERRKEKRRGDEKEGRNKAMQGNKDYCSGSSVAAAASSALSLSLSFSTHDTKDSPLLSVSLSALSMGGRPTHALLRYLQKRNGSGNGNENTIRKQGRNEGGERGEDEDVE
jgi:hypothetical protein